MKREKLITTWRSEVIIFQIQDITRGEILILTQNKICYVNEPRVPSKDCLVQKHKQGLGFYNMI